VWEGIAVLLESSALVPPPPANSAVGLVVDVVWLTQKALEGKEANKENQLYIEQLVNRAVDIAKIMENYVAESRCRDANFAHERWLQRPINGSAVKSQFKDLWRQQDAMAADFTIHFLRITSRKVLMSASNIRIFAISGNTI
jgi:hypothetical protein